MNSIEIEHEKKLDTARRALENAEVERVKEKSEKEQLQQKIQEFEHTHAQLTDRVERQDSELEAINLKMAELTRSRGEDLRSYRKMVGGFVKAFKSEARRILHGVHPDLDLTEIDKITAIDLARVAKEEEEAKKFKRSRKDNAGPSSESAIVPSQQQEPSLDLVDNLVSESVVSVPSGDLLPPETGA